jgi:hypothetical protein
MRDSIIDSLRVASNGIEKTSTEVADFNFFVILGVLFAIMLFVIFLLKKRSVTNELNDFKRKEVDMDNLLVSMYKSKELYKELSRKYHPDKFVGSEQIAKAEAIFSEISANKNNYKNLLEIEKRAILIYKK